MIFQNPNGSLNPRRTIGETLATSLKHYAGTGTRLRMPMTVGSYLERVNLPADYETRYPHDLSGGEKQRVAIARALMCQPEILICDEVTSALDVSVQASIVELLRSLMAEGLGVLFVTHDLGVVRSLADRVAVLQNGQVVEYGDCGHVMDQPTHVYTRQLMEHSLSLE